MKQNLPHPWALTIDEIATTTKTNLTDGLSDTEAAARKAQYGENIFTEDSSDGSFTIALRQFKSPLIIVLGIAVLLTLILQKWVDAGIIIFAIAVNAILGFIQEYKAERAIADLRSYILDRTRVVRNGKEFEIDARLLVPGDIIHITHGMRITADARIIQETNFSVDEALLTGESLPVSKQTEVLSDTTALPERTNMLFAGTLAVEGSAYALVTATGYQTEIGKLARLVAETKPEKTPLQTAMEKLTWAIIAIITVVVAIIFALGIAQDLPFYDMFLLSIAIIVGAVPESLPIGLTAVLAIGVERIARQRGIMRSLTAAETLGSTTLIITDKTGTLTEANMQLVDISDTTQLLDQKFLTHGIRTRYSATQKEILQLALCNSDVSIENETDHPSAWKLSGSALEVNIVRAAGLHNLRISREERQSIKLRIPFSSRHKFSVTQIPRHYLPGAYREYEDPHVVIGAPDILLARAHLDKDTYLKHQAAIKTLSEHGRRLLGVALVTPHTSNPTLAPDDIRDITFLGVLSFYDPIRKDVPAALQRIESFGVRVIMATGDLPGTAVAVAREMGWNVTQASVLTGEQLRQISDTELLEVLPRISIFARVTPEDKLRITRLHQSRGEVVAMTGDGVNDAPSLKAANIGVAVGSGSDVAKGIADLILLDDNFKTIVATIEEGKRILINIKKIFVYLMSNSLDEVILIGGSILAGVALPLSAIQIIWVNLFTGSIPAISYAFDRQALPKNNEESRTFFDRQVKYLTLGVGIFTSLALLILYFVLLEKDVPLEIAQSIIFACFGSYILVVAFSFRNLTLPIYRYPLTENKLLVFGVIFGLFLVAATLYLPWLQMIFGTTALSVHWLGFIALWLIGNVLVVEIGKWLTHPDRFQKLQPTLQK